MRQRLRLFLVRRGSRLAIILLSLLAMAGAPQTADAFLGLPRNTCARVPGLKAVAVVVDLEGPAGATREMNREELQTGVESRLRQAGITVLPRQTCPLPGVPLIYLNTRVAVIDGKFAYSIDIMCLTAPEDDRLQARLANCRLDASGLVPEIVQVRAKVEELMSALIKKYLSWQGENGPSRWGRVALLLTVGRA